MGEDKHDFWPGFTVTCNKCKSTDVILDNSMGFSAASGGWGSIDFICQSCGNRTEIADTLE